jgi:hypothetical protein
MEHASFFFSSLEKSNDSPSMVGFIVGPLQPTVLSTLLESKIIELVWSGPFFILRAHAPVSGGLTNLAHVLLLYV